MVTKCEGSVENRSEERRGEERTEEKIRGDRTEGSSMLSRSQTSEQAYYADCSTISTVRKMRSEIDSN
jgi:hypothetical protein